VNQVNKDDTDKPVLVYDKECPVCDAYSRRVASDPGNRSLQLCNAREDSDVKREITGAGLDIDQGMVLKIGEKLYYGAEAIRQLALRGSGPGCFNRLNYYLFRNQEVANVVYPVLRACRNLLLRVLGRTKINNLRIPGNDRF
jgi:predicted DCC family thiol-disulfide oxidoreductase YuxK